MKIVYIQCQPGVFVIESQSRNYVLKYAKKKRDPIRQRGLNTRKVQYAYAFYTNYHNFFRHQFHLASKERLYFARMSAKQSVHLYINHSKRVLLGVYGRLKMKEGQAKKEKTIPIKRYSVKFF